MRKSRFTEEQIVMALRQAGDGAPVAEVIRRLGITEPMFYRWKKKYGGLGGNYAFELVNFIDGERDVTAIRDVLSAEYGSVPTEAGSRFVEDLVGAAWAVRR